MHKGFAGLSGRRLLISTDLNVRLLRRYALYPFKPFETSGPDKNPHSKDLRVAAPVRTPGYAESFGVGMYSAAVFCRLSSAG